MSERERTEARNVSMYPSQWDIVEQAAQEIQNVVGGPLNVSLGLRVIVDRYVLRSADDQPVQAEKDPATG